MKTRLLAALALIATLDAYAAPTIQGCPVLPADNIWNARVDKLPVHPNSGAYLTSIGRTTGFHMDFGSGLWDGAPIGIPFITVPGTQPKVPVTFEYADESDPGPGGYPFPANAPIEGVGPADADGDRHVIAIDRDNCVLYETFYSFPQNGGASWTAGSGAIQVLASNALRPNGWTSADAAGLPIFPGLVRYDEVASGTIEHALRFTASVTQRAFIWPARHFASSNTSTARPPMGLRLRLKASRDISGLSPHARTIAQAMKTYGILLADNGSNWYVSGSPDDRWDNDVLHELDALRGSDFEAVDTSSLMIDADSGQARDILAPIPGLVVHYYQSILRRAPEPSGQAFWEAEAERVFGLGANIGEAFYAMAMQFYFGAEYAILARDDAGFVTDLYRTFFDREPDQGGFDFWMAQLAGGMPREGVLTNFMFSTEFANFIAARFGTPATRGEANAVMDFYRGLLSRLPDSGGYDFYVGQFRGAQCSGTAAVNTQVDNISSGYLNSPEYSNRGRSNAQFMADMYNAFMRRGPDLAGMQFYVNQLATGGKSREQIRVEFMASPEFGNRVNAIIAAPCVSGP